MIHISAYSITIVHQMRRHLDKYVVLVATCAKNQPMRTDMINLVKTEESRLERTFHTPPVSINGIPDSCNIFSQ